MKKIISLTLLSLIVLTFQSCNDDDENNPPPLTLAIGDFHEGGVIFFIDNTGENGLIAAISDLGFDKQWGCPTLISFGAEGIEVGTGAQNTADIIAACDDSNSAAWLCNQLIQNGYEDWFLPSKNELNLLFQNQMIINETALENDGSSFTNGNRYWSSSHDLENTVWIQLFSTGQQDGVLKDTEHSVRAIRAF
ncbi:MAG: DUF1566 domain-containing protein [Maribacter sp.]